MHTIAHDLFYIPVPLIEKIIRPIIVYVFMILLLRIFGKREQAQLNPFDLVVLLSLSNTVQNAIIGEDNSLGGGLIGAFTLLLTNYLVVRFLYSHKRLELFIEGKPAVLVRDGKPCKDALARELISIAELQSVIRRQGFEGIREVEECILQPGGAFDVKRKCPTADDVRHEELMDRFEALMNRLQTIEGRMQ